MSKSSKSSKSSKFSKTIIYWKELSTIFKCLFYGTESEYKEQTDYLESFGYNWIIAESYLIQNDK